jgi:hypothetical protein
MEPALRQLIERFADDQKISLNEAGRTLLIEGAKSMRLSQEAV